MIRLVCSITTASSLLLSAQAAAQDIELTVRVRNERSSVVSGAQVCGLLPIAEGGVGSRWHISGSPALQSRVDGYCLALGDFGPYQSQAVHLNWSKSAGVEQVGAPEYPLVDQPSAELQTLAASFASYPQGERPRRIFDWMVDNIEFIGIRRAVDGAEYALAQRRGDCTEHMLLAAELLARNGFSVRRVLGVAIPTGQNRIRASDLHNWVEYSDNRGWRIFDSSRRVLSEPGGLRYISLLHYHNNQQLSVAPITTDGQGLKLYLE